MIILYLISLLTIGTVKCMVRDFAICHDDFDLKPVDGILKDHSFTWLGFVQYLHVTTGLPHHSKAPRIVLIHRQFAVGTATDMLLLPRNYNLGKAIFGDYERDEEECGLTELKIKMGARCPRAYLEIPITEITPHPEYTRFGVGNSLALIKFIRPVKSHYMIPVCLPTLSERKKKKTHRFVFMVDYISSVPKDFESEKMAKKTLKMYTHKECRRHRMRTVPNSANFLSLYCGIKTNLEICVYTIISHHKDHYFCVPITFVSSYNVKKLGSEGVTHVLCSSGCGVRPGAPIISHVLEGNFELIGIAAGGGPCSRRTMRNRLNREPPLYIDVYPYITWIMNFITAYILPRPYPENFKLVEGGSHMAINRDYLRSRRKQKSGWRARTYAVGDNCFKSLKKQKQASFFYSEKFEAHADPPAKLNLFMEISAGIECTIVCVRMLMPNRLTTPKVLGVGGYNISIELNTRWFPWTYFFSIGLNGKNTTEKDFLKWIPERRPGFW